MEQAIVRLPAVPEGQQDRVARFLLHELDEDEWWARSTAGHESKRRALIEDVLADDQSGRCAPLDPDRL